MTTKTITRAAKPVANAKGMTGKSARKIATTKAAEKAPKDVAPKLADPSKPADTIVESKGVSGGVKHYVSANDGRSTMIPTAQWRGEIRKLAAVGQSYDAFCAAWSRASTAKLAAGVDARNAPHSAKAVQDSKATQPVKPAKVTAASRKAAAVAKASAEDSKAFKLTEKGEAKLAKLDAKARAADKLQRMATAGSIAAAIALDGVSRGDVNYAIKCKFIGY
jgi:hypothetical protein